MGFRVYGFAVLPGIKVVTPLEISGYCGFKYVFGLYRTSRFFRIFGSSNQAIWEFSMALPALPSRGFVKAQGTAGVP